MENVILGSHHCIPPRWPNKDIEGPVLFDVELGK